MSEGKPTAEEIERERSLARIFGAYALYRKSLPCRVWREGIHGWTSGPR